MKTIHKFIILAMLGCLFMYSFSGCSSSTDTSSTSTNQQTISASDYKIKFSGDIWSSVVFHHKEHADRFGDCYECHYCAGVQGESLWNCRSCHTPGNTEGLCKDDGTHGCIMAQCNYCHEDLERNAGLDCADCHTDGALANTGHFVDSPVQGLDYQTNTISGITDDAGTFYFWDGETISFFIADLLLGTAPAKTEMTPLDLIKGATDVSNPAVTNICRLLLSLDVDGNPDNGITISDAIKNEVEGRSIIFNQSTDDFGNDPDVLALFNTLNQLGAFTDSGDRSLCSATEAQDHITATLLSLNEFPTATNVVINGYLYVTKNLIGTYDYQDADGDSESGSTFKWYRYDDDQGSNEQEISGANSDIYTPAKDDEGKYIKFEVTPAAATGKSPGSPVKSDAVGPIAPDPGNLVPTATVYSGIKVESCCLDDSSQPSVYINALGAIGVNGVYQIADTARYTKDSSTGEPINPKDSPTGPGYYFEYENINGTFNAKLVYKHEDYYDQNDSYWIAYHYAVYCGDAWWIADSTGYRSRTGGAIAKNITGIQSSYDYTPPLGNWDAADSRCGNGVKLSLNGGPNDKPGITGDPIVGSTLTGDHEYNDAENDTEGQSTFRWLRSDTVNGTYQAISGATGKTYTLTAADVGKFLKFEVTPLAVTGNSPGIPTTSSYAGIGPVITSP